MDAVLNWLWQGGVVAVASSLMLLALRRARANVRYTVCWVAAIFVLGLPVLPSVRSAASIDIAALPHGDAIVALPDAWWTSSRMILAAAVLWSGIHFVRLVAAIRATRRARRRSRSFPAHLAAALPQWRHIRGQGRRARLVLSDSVTRAAVFGWGSPMIAVAPSLVRRLDAADLDRVLVHEWAHVQRYDDLASVLQFAVRVLAGWHPALWWIDRRLHVEREIACDEMSVTMTGSAKSYAECLMKLSSMAEAPRRVETAPAVLSRSGLRARIVKIVSPDQPIAPLLSRSVAAAIVSALCVLSTAVGGVTLVEATRFAAPAISSATRTLIAPLDRPSATAPPASPRTEAQRLPGRRTARSSSIQQPTSEHSSPSSQSDTQPPVSSAAHEPEPVRAAEPADASATEAGPPVPAPSAVEAPSAPPQPNASTGTPPAQTAWTAAAAGGTAIGRKSKEAGVATAGAFKRFANRVASSF